MKTKIFIVLSLALFSLSIAAAESAVPIKFVPHYYTCTCEGTDLGYFSDSAELVLTSSHGTGLTLSLEGCKNNASLPECKCPKDSINCVRHSGTPPKQRPTQTSNTTE